MRLDRPWVVVVCAASLDGRIASRTGWSRISCPRDLERLHALRAMCDAVMIGANTAIIDDPMLTVRYVPAIRQPARVVVDGRLRVPTSLRLFKTAREIPTIVLTSRKASPEKISALQNMGVHVEVVGEDHVDLPEALRLLYRKYNVRILLVEGGGNLIWNLLRHDLVDEMYVTYSGFALGNGVSIAQGEGYSTGDESPKFRIASAHICECGREVVVHYIRER